MTADLPSFVAHVAFLVVFELAVEGNMAAPTPSKVKREFPAALG
jgi:hypothetical protein